jgi:hypothetical protein
MGRSNTLADKITAVARQQGNGPRPNTRAALRACLGVMQAGKTHLAQGFDSANENGILASLMVT